MINRYCKYRTPDPELIPEECLDNILREKPCINHRNNNSIIDKDLEKKIHYASLALAAAAETAIGIGAYNLSFYAGASNQTSLEVAAMAAGISLALVAPGSSIFVRGTIEKYKSYRERNDKVEHLLE